jgi:hypothetical protein
MRGLLALARARARQSNTCPTQITGPANAHVRAPETSTTHRAHMRFTAHTLRTLRTRAEDTSVTHVSAGGRLIPATLSSRDLVQSRSTSASRAQQVTARPAPPTPEPAQRAAAASSDFQNCREPTHSRQTRRWPSKPPERRAHTAERTCARRAIAPRVTRRSLVRPGVLRPARPNDDAVPDVSDRG